MDVATVTELDKACISDISAIYLVVFTVPTYLMNKCKQSNGETGIVKIIITA